MEAEPKRPFWKYRRFWGGTCAIIGIALSTIPALPIATLGGAVIATTGTASTVLTFVGTYVFGWGQGKASERNKTSE